jgi:hypothetical protein
MMRKTVEDPRCSNGENCVSYSALGEPSKLSRSNPGTICFACKERRVASELKTASANKKTIKRRKAEEPHRSNLKGLGEHLGQEHAQTEQRAREVLERRRKSVFTCERGLRSALASGDERLVRRWSRSLREAEDRLVWAEADLARAKKRVWSEDAR